LPLGGRSRLDPAGISVMIEPQRGRAWSYSRFCVVELDTSSESSLGQKANLGGHELIKLGYYVSA